MASSGLLSRHDVESIATGMGLKFQFISDPNHQVLNGILSRDPHTVYLFEPGYPIKYPHDTSPFDAELHYADGSDRIHWGFNTKAYVRKVLSRDVTATAAMTCVICFEGVGPWNHFRCPECNSTVCAFCEVKLTLNADGINRIKQQIYQLLHRCPECRGTYGIEAGAICAKAIDRKREFSKEQQEALSLIKKHDPKHRFRYNGMKQLIDKTEQLKSKLFRKGSRVIIGGMKDEKWNDKKAVIIAKRVIKNGVIRWPVRLMNRSKATALIKQCNMSLSV